MVEEDEEELDVVVSTRSMLNLFQDASSNLFSSLIVSNLLHRPTDVYLTFRFFGRKRFFCQYDIRAVEKAVDWSVKQCGKYVCMNQSVCTVRESESFFISTHVYGLQ